MSAMVATLTKKQQPSSETTSEKHQEVAKAIGLHKKRSRLWWILLPALGVGGFFLFGGTQAEQKETVKWKTTPLVRGDVVTTVSATGTLQPQRTIAVGSEVSGRIEDVLVEPNDIVKKGQVLATFDKRSLQNSLQETSASLDSVKADIVRAQTTLDESKSNEQRTLGMAEKGIASSKDVESVKAVTSRAQAELQGAKAQQRLASARVQTAKTNLDKAVIVSPIDGVVLTRSIEPGNTVSSSLQSPEFFTIAEDLAQMELHIAVDEADVGQVQPEQKATFTVSAWPDKKFDAIVSKVYLAPTTTSNVVTYTVVLTVDNKDNLLRPGMTANASITAGVQKDTLQVPNRALRFNANETETKTSFSLAPQPPGRGRPKQGSYTPGVWVLRDGKAVHVEVKAGESDGRVTAIQSDELKEGDLLIIGKETAQ
jgi:HlyD family secretion protein